MTILLGCSLATGCATGLREYVHNGFKVGPNYCKPAAPVSPHWIDDRNPQIKSEPADDWAWWRVFRDPVLDNLIVRTHAQNISLREAGFRVMETRAQRAVTVGNLFPQTQQAFGSYSRNQLSLETGIAGTGGGGGGPAVDRNFDLYTLGGRLAWELDFWGRYRRAIEAADGELNASIENYDDVLVILLGEVGTTYVEIRTAQQRIRYAEANVKAQTGSLELAKIRLQQEAASQLDVAQAQTIVAQTAAVIPALQIELRQAENRLCVLLGIPPQDLAPLLDGPRPIPLAPPEVAIGVPADLVRRRPDVRRAERLAAAQSARIGIAEADMYPAFTINGDIFVEANQFSHLFRSSAVGGSIGPSFNWNILNYGRIRNSVVIEDARFMQRVAQYQNTVLTANREAEDAIVDFLRSQEQAQTLLEGVRAAQESRDLVADLYRGGRADFGRVFVAENALVLQQDALARAQGSIATALVNLYRAIGGGWQIRLGPTPLPEVVPLPTTEPVEGTPEQPAPIEALPKPEVDAPAPGAQP